MGIFNKEFTLKYNSGSSVASLIFDFTWNPQLCCYRNIAWYFNSYPCLRPVAQGYISQVASLVLQVDTNSFNVSKFLPSHPWCLCWRKPSPAPDHRCKRPGARSQHPGTGQTLPHWGPQFGCSSFHVETQQRSTSPSRPGAPYNHTEREREWESLESNVQNASAIKCWVGMFRHW